VKDADLIGIQTELKDGVLLTRLKQTYNLK